MKKILTTTIATTAMTLIGFCNNTFGQSYSYTSAGYGSGNTKGDAVASALMQLPYGAKIQKVDLNGYSVKQYVPGIGYTQTQGSYKCKVIYKKD